ncbi:hypothetical protein tinsulaeT_28030 [Thalassotalea insulae]|uniref:Uncharacterized protein n=1 Tax=Thalassotalea insulae TaxID=2056778 RepID=A0ABQ6GU57_9GAMM|nr:hypothetical protein [Thalassotalea insulae]GLX79463.1 hypothetical protein tinsulaeT_28030 [Thalassotalea insulae]
MNFILSIWFILFISIGIFLWTIRETALHYSITLPSKKAAIVATVSFLVLLGFVGAGLYLVLGLIAYPLFYKLIKWYLGKDYKYYRNNK